MPQKRIKKTITEIMNICDYKGCEEDVNFLYAQRICEGCEKVFCDEHLFIVDDKIKLCSYCSNIYEKEISPFLFEIEELDKKINKIDNEKNKIRKKMNDVCKKNYI